MIDCFRNFNFQSLDQINEMTMKEYRLRREAFKYQCIDRQYYLHLSAFLNLLVRAEKKSGNKTRPVYRKFEQFFNYRKELEKVKSEKPSQPSMMSKLQKYFQGKGGES